MGKLTVVDAALNRLLQKAHRLNLNGDSLRRHRNTHEAPKLDPS
nr:ATP-binding protein [Acidithiobacillus montserratensis]